MKDLSYFRKGTDLKFALSVQLWQPVPLWRWLKWQGKTSAIRLSKYVKIKVLSPLFFPGKTDYFLHYLGYFWQELERGLKSKGRSKFGIPCFNHTILGQLPVKNIWFQHFPILRLYVTKDISERSFKFGCFQISNPKNQNIFIKKKMNKDFFLFSFNIGNFFQVGLEQKNQLIQTKKNVANQPCSKGTFLVCTEKIYIKKSFKYCVSITIQNKFLDSSLLLRE